MWNEVISFVKIVIPSNSERVLMGIGGMIGAVASFLFGDIDAAFTWLLVMTVIDYITGTIASFKSGSWSSEQGFKGLFKKFFMFFVIALCNGIDQATHTDMLKDIAVFAYAINEAGSIIENIELLGYGKLIPPFLKRGLEVIKEKEKELLKHD